MLCNLFLGAIFLKAIPEGIIFLLYLYHYGHMLVDCI